ncbi:MAG: class I SAM-dependent methyltransferase [Dehalococcoidia bacterium]
MSTTLNPDQSWFEIDPAFYANGGVCFSQQELMALAEMEGERALVSPANGGEEALSIVNLGAQVSIFDTKENSERARTLVAGSGLKVTFIEGKPGSAAIPGGPYDTIYSSFGLLSTLEYFDDWAQGLAGALKPGGRLVIHEVHPVAYVPGAYKGVFAVAHSYFDEDEHHHGASWTMGDLISALGIAGLATVHLEETPDSDRYQTPLDRFHNVRWDVRWRLPGAFVLVAFKA